MNLSVVILTYNEEANVGRCLTSLEPLRAPIFVVDSGSTDGTAVIARKAGCTVVTHPFATHAQQWAWALEHLPLQTDWVLALDADQALTPELAAELRDLDPEPALEGFYLRRRQVFRGRWIRHGAYYPKYLLKLFRRQCVYFDAHDLLDHHFYVSGPTRRLRHDLVEANVKENDICFWTEKHTRYAALVAREELCRLAAPTPDPLRATLAGNPDQRTLWLKQRWRKLPLYVRPFLYFVYRYFFRLGFMDGKEGFIFHFLHSFWFRLLVDIKREELSRGTESLSPSSGQPRG